MTDSKVSELKRLVELCSENPSLLQNQSLSFFKGYLERMGAKIPSASSISDKVDGDAVEFDVELDDSNVVGADNVPPQKTGDPSTEVTAKNLNAARILKSKAIDAHTEGKLNEAVDYLTEAIVLNPHCEMLYATRGSIFVEMKNPNAAIRDADAALQIKPDSVKGHEIRGLAMSMLGCWDKAANDLRVALGSDYDKEISSVLEQVETNAKNIEENPQKHKSLQKGKEQYKVGQESQRRQAKAQVETNAKEIGEHLQKHKSLQKGKEQKKVRQDSQRRQAKPQVETNAKKIEEHPQKHKSLQMGEQTIVKQDSQRSQAKAQVDTNAKKIEEHLQKQKSVQKRKYQNKVGQDSQSRQTKAQGTNEMEKRKEHPSNSATGTASASEDGQVIGIHSSAELESMLNAASKASRLVLLYFSATWCGPCNFISPIYEELAGKYREVCFLKVDIDEAAIVARMWNITHLPTTCFVKNGKEVDRVMIIDKSSFENKITQHAG